MGEKSEPGDGELLERWRAGNNSAGNQLFERYFDSIYRFFCAKVGDDQALDLVQQTFLACVNGRDRVVDGDKFRSYLFGIAYRKLMRLFRNDYRRRDKAQLDRSIAESQTTPSQRMAKKAEHRVLLSALRRLPVKDQVVLELYFWERLTRKQLASVLGISDLAAASRINRAKHKLRASIAQQTEDPDLGTRTTANFEFWLNDLREQSPLILRAQSLV